MAIVDIRPRPGCGAAARNPVRGRRQRYLMVHGSPWKTSEYLFHDKPDATFARIAEGANADVIVCGHTDRPYDTTVGAVEFRRVEYDIEWTAPAARQPNLYREFAEENLARLRLLVSLRRLGLGPVDRPEREPFTSQSRQHVSIWEKHERSNSA